LVEPNGDKMQKISIRLGVHRFKVLG